MPNRPDKRRRKEQLQQWQAQQRAAARAKFPLSDQQMQAMFDYLSETLPMEGCDHTLRLTRIWLEIQVLEVQPVVAWLHDNGGFCDCEALANAEEQWRNANRDVDW